MQREFDGKLTKFVPSPKAITTAILTLEVDVTAADYIDLARFYLQPGSVTLYAFQQELPLHRPEPGTQMTLEAAPVTEDASTADAACALCGKDTQLQICDGCLGVLADIWERAAEETEPSLYEDQRRAIAAARALMWVSEAELEVLRALVLQVVGTVESDDLDPLQAELEAENDARQEAEDMEAEGRLGDDEISERVAIEVAAGLVPEDEERPAPADDGLIDFETLPGVDQKPCQGCPDLGACDFASCEKLKGAVAASVEG